MKGWFKMFFCLLLIWCFVQLAPIVLTKIPTYDQLIQKSESMDIDNAALFYSEEALTSLAESELNERLGSGNE